MGITRLISFLVNAGSFLFFIYFCPCLLIKFSVFKVIWLVRIRDLADHAAGISGCTYIVRNVLCHYASRADHNVISNLYTRKNAAASADPHIVPDGDRNPVLKSGIPALRMDRMPGCVNTYIFWKRKYAKICFCATVRKRIFIFC